MGIVSFIDNLLGFSWRTVGNHRCLISRDGRIVKGPRDWEGVHVSRLPSHCAEVRDIHAQAEDCASDGKTAGKLFKTKAQAYRALLDNNPEMFDTIEGEDGKIGKAYREWLRDRKGRKPSPSPGESRFDAINEKQERTGYRRICCYTEAVYACLPASRQWSEIDLELLAETFGYRVRPPDRLLESQDPEISACEAKEDQLVAEAKQKHADPLDPPPF